ARGVDEERELLERGFGLLDGTGPDARRDEERPLAEDGKIDLGGGEASPLAWLATTGHDRDQAGAFRSTTVSKTVTTGPPRRTVSPSATVRSPPGTRTTTRSPTRPRRRATAAAAAAPVPHDSVSPTPRSQTRIRTASAPVTATNSTLVRFGNLKSCS